ncbi:HIT-like domain-containing protein, partial [Ochromonadaceae sp. CCMP2298]
GAVTDCLFCRIQKREEQGTIVFEDEDFVVFKTIKPATHTHLLVTPRRHIRDLDSLQGAEGAALVREMVAVGKIALGQYADDAQFCFHVPPFTSIDHLHLHAIAQPGSMGRYGRMKYSQGTYYCRNAESAIRKL